MFVVPPVFHQANFSFLYTNVTLEVNDNLAERWKEMEFNEFEPRFKSAKTHFKLSAGLNLETFDTILSGTNHI